MKLKNIAFTLAETLVVMGIIGVIAALTIPNLSQSTGNKEKITKIQKIYANMQEALDRATAIYGPYSTWGLTNDNSHDSPIVGDRVTEFMKVASKTKNGASYRIELADGTIINLVAYQVGFDFDITLAKGQRNEEAKNYFWGRFWFNDGGAYFLNMDKDFSTLLEYVTHCATKDNAKNADNHSYCQLGAIPWIIRYGNMDYLKLNASSECPNGKTPTESNPRCN